MRYFKPQALALVLVLAMALVLGAACGSAKGAVGPQGPRGDAGAPGPAGPNMIVAMAQVNADASMGQSYNVDSVTWDTANRRYVITLTGNRYAHDTFITIVTPGYANYTASYAADNGNLVVSLRNAGTAVGQQDHFSFMVLRAP